MGSLEGHFDTKLHEAVRYGDTEEVKIALSQGYDPNLIGVYHWSALHEAAYNGEKEILKLLLEKKGDPNKPDYQLDRTATHYATIQGHIECLRMLLDAGGRYDIKDSDGKDCLDLATPTGRKILEKLKVKDLLLKDDSTHKDEGISTEPSSSVSTSRKSSLTSLPEKGPALGYVHLSVEYHSAKSTLKIRIWQLSDLLLPPPNTSMIHSIYVKSYLQPDKKRESKRKTEEVKVDSSEGHVHWRRKKEDSVKHVFKPSNFKFSRCLEYSGITAELVKEKLLQIEVCITQRYSHRSFLIGMVRMSLKAAVKKLVKEKLPLLPCMNHTIPTNMKVYCASDLNVMNNTAGGDFFYSSPNVRIELPDDLDDDFVKAVSDPDLQPKQMDSLSTEVDMNHQYNIVPNIPRLDLSSAVLDESGYSSEIHVSMPSELESPDSDSSKSSSLFSTKHEVPSTCIADTKKGKVIQVLENIQEHHLPERRSDERKDAAIVITDLDGDDLQSVTVDDVKQHQNVEKSVSKSKKSKSSDEDAASRPDTPTWDYYDIPTEVVTQKVEESTSPWKKGAAPVILPMQTTMEVTSNKESSTIPFKQEKSVRRSKKKSSVPIPGKAVPLVPNIVITNAEHDVGKTKTSNACETIRISLPERYSEKEDANEIKVDYDLERGARPKTKSVLKKVEKTSFINVGKTIGKVEGGKSNETKTGHVITSTSEREEKFTKPKPKFRKFKKVCDGNVELKTMPVVNRNAPKSVDSESSNEKLPRTYAASDRGVSKNAQVKVTSMKKLVNKNYNDDSPRNTAVTNPSVIVDMDKLAFSASGAHVIELIEEDISITELAEDDPLFTDRSDASVSTFTDDIEIGESSYRLRERVSPTKYMIPMQVYDVDDTSCDESVSCDKPYIPVTEL